MGSAYELDYQLLLSKDLGYINISNYDEINAKIISAKKQLASLLKKVRETI